MAEKSKEKKDEFEEEKENIVKFKVSVEKKSEKKSGKGGILKRSKSASTKEDDF